MDLRITGKVLEAIHYVGIYGNRFRRRQRFLLNVLFLSFQNILQKLTCNYDIRRTCPVTVQLRELYSSALW